jgi:hypothetical protein
LADLANELSLDIQGTRATAVRLGEARGGSWARAEFDVWRVRTLTYRDVTDLPHRTDDARPLLVIFDQASAEARAELRNRRVSYASPAGELFLLAPGVLVDRPASAIAHPTVTSSEIDPQEVSPFSKRAARVARWLLLNPGASPLIGELASTVDLSRPFTSQVVRALAAGGHLELVPDKDDARARRVRVRSAGALLDAWADEWQRRRRREVSWDIGTHGVEDTLAVWVDAARHAGSRRWALGGPAGAERIVRALEPTDALLWIDESDFDVWRQLLLAQPRRRGQTPLRVAVAPDPWTLSLGASDDGVRVADPVQLYLDCRSSGERALEAADALRRRFDW